MGRYDVKSKIDVEVSLAQSGNRTATANGTSAELAGFHGAAVLVDVAAYTDGSHTFEVQESDDDSTWTAVADADLDGTEPIVDAAGDVGQHYIGYTGNAKYLRVITSAVTGTTTGANYGAYIIKGDASQFPAH